LSRFGIALFYAIFDFLLITQFITYLGRIHDSIGKSMFSKFSIFTRSTFAVMLIMCTIFVSGCAAMPLIGRSAATVIITSVPLKITIAAGVATLEVIIEEFSGVRIDIKGLLDQIVVDEVETGVPPTDEPVLMLVSKETNDIFYWELTDKVKMVRLRHEQPGAIELKVINESPLRIELWIDGDIEAVDITVEMKE
jgi:hypothetical protein